MRDRPAAPTTGGLVDTGDDALRELSDQGHTTIRAVLDADLLDEARQRIDAVYDEQVQAFGLDRLAAIGELDIARAPLVHDPFFLRAIAANPLVLELTARVIGDYQVLHLQNAIINRPGVSHHQAAWHRDLPYQSFVASPPLAVSALFCIDPFTAESGCTWCVPGSHLVAAPPDAPDAERRRRPMEADAGDVLLFDSMLLHRAGSNQGRHVRRAVNHVFTVGVVGQQIDLPRALGGRYRDDDALARLLGYASTAIASVAEYRQRRMDRVERS